MKFLRRLSKRDRRTLTIGASAVFAILLVSYGLLPYLEAQQGLNTQLRERSAQLSRTLRHIGGENTYREQLREVRQELDFYRGQLLDAADPNLARVELEGIVRSLADETQTEIARSSFLPARNQDVRYAKLTLQITVRENMESLKDFLYALSDHPKYLVVDALNVNASNRRGEITLQHRLNISAYARLSEQ